MVVSNPPDATSDECLINAIVCGDVSAMETLYERYGRTFFSLAYRMVASKQVAEDLVQLAFFAIWHNCSSYSREVGNARSWLFSIMHYRVIDYLRRRRFCSAKEIPWTVAEYDEPHLLVPDPWEEIWRLEQAQFMSEALQSLPKEQRSIIELAYFEGLTHKEIANHCGIPLGTVKSRMRLGLHHLKSMLTAQGIVGV